MAGLEQGDMQVQVVLGVVAAFGDGTDRLADLQAEIPQRIEDDLDEGFVRGGVARHQHQ